MYRIKDLGPKFFHLTTLTVYKIYIIQIKIALYEFQLEKYLILLKKQRYVCEHDFYKNVNNLDSSTMCPQTTSIKPT